MLPSFTCIHVTNGKLLGWFSFDNIIIFKHKNFYSGVKTYFHLFILIHIDMSTKNFYISMKNVQRNRWFVYVVSIDCFIQIFRKSVLIFESLFPIPITSTFHFWESDTWQVIVRECCNKKVQPNIYVFVGIVISTTVFLFRKM